MTNKKLMLIAGVVVLCILMCLLGVMCSSSGGETVSEPTGTTGTEKLTYTVTLKDEAGSPVSEVGVYIYADFTKEELVWFARTDDNGQMTFTDLASDNYVAVLDGVPAGYLVEEYYPLTGEATEIVLEAGLMEGDLNNVTYKLGDLMLDFTVTAPDGTEYTLSKLLEEYSAVVLNFWYLQCDPCKSEFPYLQEAYEKYSDDVAVLALNPVNQDNAEIAQFQKDNGYSFPMMACDLAWEKAMQLTAYPTTVVIDRYGKICLIHKGSVTDAETFETIFGFYSDEEYEQTVSKNLEELEEAAGVVQTVGTVDNPVEMGVTPSFQVTVEPGQLMYYNIYRLTTTLYVNIRNENAYVIYNGKEYYPTNGTVSLAISADDASTACPLVFGNSGKETQTYTVTMGSAAGTMGNPFTLTLGDFTTNVAAGNETGVWYTYTPTKTGLFTIEVQSVTAGVDYGISVNTYTANGVGTIQRTIQSDGTTNAAGNKTVSINAYAGKAIQVTVSTLPDSNNAYPAATFKLNASLAEGESLDTTYVENITYSVNITDEKGVGIGGVKMIMTSADNQPINLTTNENGVAYTKQVPTKKVDGNEVVLSYPVMITVPNGYKAKTTELVLTKDRPSASIKFDTIAKVAYSITVVDQDGKPVYGAEVYFTDPVTETIVSTANTDASGKVNVTIAQGDYTVSVAKEGYATESAAVTADSRTAAITLMKGDENDYQSYTVTVKDYRGNPVSGVTVTFMQGSTIGGKATTNASGVATRKLFKGTYTMALSGYYIYTNATLTEASPTGTIVVVPPVKGTTDTYMGEQVYCVYEGMTYLDGLTGKTSSTGAATYDYFLFQPTESSIYKFTVFGSDAKISFWGTSTQYQNNMTSDMSTVTDPEDENYTGTYYDSANNCFAYDVGLDENKPPIIIGITGDTDCVLAIEEIGHSLVLPTELYTYENKHTPNATGYSVPSGAKKTFDLSQTITLTEQDGFYYYNGKQVFIELAATDGRISFKDMQITYGTGFNKIYYMASGVEGCEYQGEHNHKEAYEEAIIEYVEAAIDNNAANGYYPLTEDLVYMLKEGGTYRGWYDSDPDNPDYLFKGQTVLDGNHWMFLLCYFG